MNGGKKKNIEDEGIYSEIIKILNTNNNIHDNNIIANIEINKDYANNNQEKKGKNNGFNYNNIYNKKSKISVGNNNLEKLNNSKKYNIFNDNKKKNLIKNNSKKRLLLKYNPEEKEEKKACINISIQEIGVKGIDLLMKNLKGKIYFLKLVKAFCIAIEVILYIKRKKLN